MTDHIDLNCLLEDCLNFLAVLCLMGEPEPEDKLAIESLASLTKTLAKFLGYGEQEVLLDVDILTSHPPRDYEFMRYVGLAAGLGVKPPSGAVQAIALCAGKMPLAEREKVLREFAKRANEWARILVSTVNDIILRGK